MTSHIVLNPKQNINNHSKFNDLNHESQWNGRKISLVVILGVSSALAATAAVVAGLFAIYITAISCGAAALVLLLSAILASRIKISPQVIGIQKIPQKLEKNPEKKSEPLQEQNPLNAENEKILQNDTKDPSSELYAQTLRDKELIESLDQKILEQQKIIEEIKSKIPAEISAEDDASVVDHEVTQQQLEELTLVLDELIAERDQAKELQKSIIQLNEEILRHKEEHNKKQEEIEALKKKAEEVPQNRSQEQQLEYEHALKQIEELQASKDQGLQIISELQENLKSMQVQTQEIKSLKEALERNTSEKNSIEQRLREKEEEAKSSQHINEEEKKQLKENIDELKHQLEAVTVKGKRLSRRMQSLPSSENLAALESRKSLNESLGEEEILSIQDNKKTFANKKTNQTEELEHLRQELSEAKATIGENNREIRTKADRIKEQAKEISELRKKIEELQAEIVDLNVDALQKQIAQQKDIIKKASKDKEAIKNELRSLKEYLQSFIENNEEKFSFDEDEDETPEEKIHNLQATLEGFKLTLQSILANN